MTDTTVTSQSLAKARQQAQAAADVATESMSRGRPPDKAILRRAREDLAGALAQCGRDIEVLFLAFQFHIRIGEHEEAERWALRRIELAEPDSRDMARALSNLGLAVKFRKDLAAAEGHFRRAIEIDRAIDDPHGLARDMANLALVFEDREDLDNAERLYLESLVVAHTVPGTVGEELIAGTLSNLGDIALWRGRLKEAERLWRCAAAMFDRLGITKWRATFDKRFADLELRKNARP